MTAAASDRDAKRQDGRLLELDVMGSAARTFYKDTLAVYNTDGFAVVGVNSAGHRFAGVVTHKVIQTDTAASNGDKKLQVWLEGIFEMVGASLAATDVGRPVWLSDDQTFSLTQTNVGPIGKIARYVSSTRALIDIGRATHGAAQFRQWALGTDAFASGSTTKEVAVGLTSATTGHVTPQTLAATLVLGTDLTITAGAITVGRSASGTAESNFNYAFAGY